LFNQGNQLFANLAEFNFIAGYTVSIFPYEFGKYEEFEKVGRNMLKRAMKIDSDNPIYRVTYFGSILNYDDQLYTNALVEAAPAVLKKFSGKGILNDYFRNALYRAGYQAYR
jgi:hypothetical protein